MAMVHGVLISCQCAVIASIRSLFDLPCLKTSCPDWSDHAAESLLNRRRHVSKPNAGAEGT